jgi:hypothetical protein
MFVGIVKQHRLAFFPVVLFTAINQHAFFVAGDNHTQVHTQNA